MVIQTIKFITKLTFEEVLSVAQARAPEFQKISGLIQKYYVRTDIHDQYAGIYIWDSAEAMQKYRESELAAGIPAAYQVLGTPEIETYEVVFKLRD